MTGSLEKLLEKAIDYAGLFPPALLSMDEAVAEYAAILSSNKRWIVNRFAVPVSRLAELGSHLPPMQEAWPLTVIGRDLAGYADDRKLIEDFRRQFEQKAKVQAFEVKANAADIELVRLASLANSSLGNTYVELDWGDEMSEAIHEIADTESVGVKARLGGNTAGECPDPAHLAEFLQECIQIELPFKLTAGLHHPLRHFDESVKSPSHGFLNILTAGTLAYEHDLSVRELAEILSDESPASFHFEENSLKWKTIEGSMDSITELRTMFRSFGSCSIDEPLTDLCKLGLLNAESMV